MTARCSADFVASPISRASLRAHVSTPTPHDALFKAAFSIQDNAAAELRHVLGPELAALFDLKTLTLCSGSYVSEALRARHADLLFTVRAANRDVFLYVFYEHKSAPEPWLGLWLLGFIFFPILGFGDAKFVGTKS